MAFRLHPLDCYYSRKTWQKVRLVLSNPKFKKEAGIIADRFPEVGRIRKKEGVTENLRTLQGNRDFQNAIAVLTEKYRLFLTWSQ